MSRKEEYRQASMDLLTRKIQEVLDRLDSLERQGRISYAPGGVVLPEPPDILPRGRYEATIESVSRRRSKTDKWYWSVQLGEVKDHPTKKLWLNLLEFTKSPAEETCAQFGITLERTATWPWRGSASPALLEGQRCVAQVAISYYNGRRYNEVESISPLPR